MLGFVYVLHIKRKTEGAAFTLSDPSCLNSHTSAGVWLSDELVPIRPGSRLCMRVESDSRAQPCKKLKICHRSVPFRALQDGEVLQSHYCLRNAWRRLWVLASLNLLFNFGAFWAVIERRRAEGTAKFYFVLYIFYCNFFSGSSRWRHLSRLADNERWIVSSHELWLMNGFLPLQI